MKIQHIAATAILALAATAFAQSPNPIFKGKKVLLVAALSAFRYRPSSRCSVPM